MSDMRIEMSLKDPLTTKKKQHNTNSCLLDAAGDILSHILQGNDLLLSS
jgi:hypothetical protein